MAARLDQLREFLKSRPDDPFLKYAIGIELKNAGDAVKARESFESLAKQHPEYVPTYYHWGQSLETLGLHEEALNVYDRGIVTAGAAGDKHAVEELQRAAQMVKDMF